MEDGVVNRLGALSGREKTRVIVRGRYCRRHDVVVKKRSGDMRL